MELVLKGLVMISMTALERGILSLVNAIGKHNQILILMCMMELFTQVQ